MGYWQYNTHKRKYYDPVWGVWKSEGSIYVPSKKSEPPPEPEEEPIPPEPPIPRQTIVSGVNQNDRGYETRTQCQDIYPFYQPDGVTPQPIDAWNSLIILSASYPSTNVTATWSTPAWQLLYEEPEGSGTYIPGTRTTSKTSAEITVTVPPYIALVIGNNTWKLGTTAPPGYDWLVYTSELAGFTNTDFTTDEYPGLLLNLPAIDAGTRVWRYKIKLTNVYTRPNGSIEGPVISEWPLCVHPTPRPPGTVAPSSALLLTPFEYETTAGPLFTNTFLASANYDASAPPNPNGGSTVRYPLPREDVFYEHDVAFETSTTQYVWRLPELNDYIWPVWHVEDTTSTIINRENGTEISRATIQNKPWPALPDNIQATPRWDSGSHVANWVPNQTQIEFIHAYWLSNNQGKYVRFRVIVRFNRPSEPPPAFDETLVSRFGVTNSLQNMPVYLFEQSYQGTGSYNSNGTKARQEPDGSITVWRGADPADPIPEICLVGYNSDNANLADGWDKPKLYSTDPAFSGMEHYYISEPSISPTYNGPYNVNTNGTYSPPGWTGTDPAGHRSNNMYREGEALGLMFWKIRLDGLPTRDIAPAGVKITGAQTHLPTNISVVDYSPQAIWLTTDTPEPIWGAGGIFEQDTEDRKVSFELPLACNPDFVWVKNSGRVIFWDVDTPTIQRANIYGSTSGGGQMMTCRVPPEAIKTTGTGHRFTVSRLHPIQLQLKIVSTVITT